MMKKVWAVVLAAVMVASLAACGSSGKQKHADSEIYIGGIGPLTGQYANYGTSVQHGAEIAVKEINEGDSTKKVDNTEVIKTLIELGAKVNAKDIFGRTALDKAEDDRIKAILKAAGAR